MNVVTERSLLALFGAVGAIAPDIVLVYSKRWTQPQLDFSLGQYFAATAIYMALAAAVAIIFPYKGKKEPWKAFAVGVALTPLIAALLAVHPDQHITTRGAEALQGTLRQLMALR